MPKRKSASIEPPGEQELRERKRSRGEDERMDTTLVEDPVSEPSKDASHSEKSVMPMRISPDASNESFFDQALPNAEIESATAEDEQKPTPRRRGRPPKKQSANGVVRTPTKSGWSAPATPRKSNGFTPSTYLAADRSAQKKSAKLLIDRAVGEAGSDDEEELAREIYQSSEDEEDDDDVDERNGNADSRQQSTGESSQKEGAETPSKTPRRRGRPKRAKSPTPPRDLPPHELYFLHNKPGRPQTSNNTLASLNLLTHEEYFELLNTQEERHASDIEHLESLHAESFPQWAFELSQGFSLCLYGLGSKRSLLQKLAKHLYARRAGNKNHSIMIVNGYAHNTTIREVLSSLRPLVDPTQKIPLSTPSSMVLNILSHLSATDIQLTIIVNSIDAPPLRRPSSQSVLGQLAAHPQVQLVCSADTPDFPLLWDIGVRSAFNFAFHDCTTFAPFTVELDVVDEVHELLGRKASRVNGREGVAFVLRSLPDNAKKLFVLITGEVLIAMEEEGATAEGSVGVEYRMVYNKAVEEFICSSEMAFRTLLKEFHDHQIITSSKDALGTEMLSVPFSKEELEAIFEDLMS